MNILHATTDPDLITRLNQMLASADRADIAVGYFFVSGFESVAEKLTPLSKVRLLVGRTDRPTLEEIAAGIQQAETLRARLTLDGAIRRSQRAEVAAQAVRRVEEGVGLLPQTNAEERSVRTLREFIASGRLEVRTYVRGTLHAKAYLCWYPDHAEPGAAIVGSSNFTLAGFTGNTELNVRVTGDAEMAELKRWFDALWAESVDITEDLAVRLDRSWAIACTPPYHVYLKALYELYRDQLATPELEPLGRHGPPLPNFQLDAVRRGLKMIDQHGGCFIGDVVGLGKTFVGAELLRQLSYTERNPPLIVCPAALIPMWERTNELFGLGARVVSMSVIAPPPGPRYDEELEEYVENEPAGPGLILDREFANRGAVLVDEAHNFRNPGARRYQALHRYLETGDHKVILLSATPQNLGPKDIYHQLRLFLDDTDHGLDLEPLHLEEYFSAVQEWYRYRIEVENWQEDYARWQLEQQVPGAKRVPPPAEPAQPSRPHATIEAVLNPTFIRRRRKDIKELYGEAIEVAGKPARFPDPVLENLSYGLDRVYAKAGTIEEIQKILASHAGARYQAAEYVRPEFAARDEYKDLFRARNRIARLIRHLLFKRLESSIAAFRTTLEVLIRSNRAFRESLKEGFVPIGQTATRMLAGEAFDPDILIDILQQEEERRRATGAKRTKLVHPTEHFLVERWLQDLDADWRVLDDLHQRIAPITPADDDKLQALRKFLARPEVRDGKVLIFSEAQTTVDYLYEQLNPGGADPTIARMGGGNRAALQDVVKRFAPKANLRERERLSGPEIRILIATDVLSEGQNLQDCNRILNYDLHWNPVRLIQRFGRVDRIGTEHETIYLHNTWPDLAVDAQLALTDRLIRRIQAFHDFIGLDSRLLSESERVNPAAMYRIYAEQRLPEGDDVLDEVASFQRGVALLERIQAENPDLWEVVTNLPDGIRSALRVRAPEADLDADRNHFIQNVLQIDSVQLPLTSAQQETGVRSPFDDPRPGESVVLIKTGDRAGAYVVGSDRQPRRIAAGQFVKAVECPPNEPAQPLPADTNERVMAAYATFRQEAAARLGRQRRPGGDTRLRRYLSKHLRLAREEFQDDPEELRRIGVLQQIFLDHLPGNILNEVDEVRNMRLEGRQLIRRLEALRTRHRLNPREDDTTERPTEADVIRIICSDGLTGG